MTHEDTERIIAKAELAFFAANPHIRPQSVARCSIDGDRATVYNIRGKKLAEYRVTVTRFSVRVDLLTNPRDDERVGA